MHLYELVILNSCILQKLVTWILKNKKLYDFNKFTSDALMSELFLIIGQLGISYF
jgi:hypothetical protein